jgi:PAS domain-containing protein
MFGFIPMRRLKTVDLSSIRQTERLLNNYEGKGFIENFEIQVQRKDARRFWISSLQVVCQRGIRGSVMIDITERKQSEEALRAKEEFLKLILDNIPQFIFWKDRNSVYLGCNQTLRSRRVLIIQRKLLA